jgi:hypothetical protein
MKETPLIPNGRTVPDAFTGDGSLAVVAGRLGPTSINYWTSRLRTNVVL